MWGKFTPPHRRLPAFSDRLPAISFSCFLHVSGIRGCPINLDRVSSAGLVFSRAHLLILIAAFKSRFTNSIGLLPPVELIHAGIPRSRALCAVR